jgi:hypothetical protein
MKQLYILIPIILSITSCSESFKDINAENFNAKIINLTNIETPEALITLYYNYPQEEGIPKISISASQEKDSSYTITLINEGVHDDSMAGEKIVMKAKRNGNTWTVLQIKKNWKCNQGRGHSNWDTTFCN